MIELIHLHIPKTAGRSFFRVLNSVYGEKVEGPVNRRKYFIDRDPPENYSLLDEISPNKTVLNGPLEYKRVSDIVKSHNSKIIAWMRGPVESVISHYYFAMRKVIEKPAKVHPDYSFSTTLLAYASRKENINLMSEFLDGLTLDQIFFIGLTEHFNENIKTLASILRWKKYRMPQPVNDNSSFKKDPACATKVVNEETRDQIRDSISSDVKYYEMAKALHKIKINGINTGVESRTNIKSTLNV